MVCGNLALDFTVLHCASCCKSPFLHVTSQIAHFAASHTTSYHHITPLNDNHPPFLHHDKLTITNNNKYIKHSICVYLPHGLSEGDPSYFCVNLLICMCIKHVQLTVATILSWEPFSLTLQWLFDSDNQLSSQSK